MSDRDLELQIRAKNLTADAFKKIQESLKLLESQQEQTTSKGVSWWGKLFATIGGGVAVGNLVSDAFKSAASQLAQIPNQLIALGERGADVADVRGHFTSLTTAIGETSAAMLGELRTAFGGTLSDFDLMRSTNEVLGKGVKLTAADMGILARASRTMADAVGGDAKRSFDSLLTGIANGQERTLKQLPLNMANIERSVKDFAAGLDKEVSALTESEKQHALRNAVLEESKRILAGAGEIENDFADNVAAARVQIDNWKDSLAESMAAYGPTIQGFGGMAASASALIPLLGSAGLTGAASGLAGALLGPAGLVVGLAAAGVAWTLWKTSEIQNQTELLAQAARVLGRGVSDVGEATNILKAYQAGLTGQQLQLVDAMGKAIGVSNAVAEAYQRGQGAAGRLKDGITSLSIDGFGPGGNSAVTFTDKLRLVEQQVNALTEAQRKEIAAAQQLGGTDLEKVKEKYKLTDAHVRILTEGTKAYTESLKAQQQLIDQIFGNDEVQKVKAWADALQLPGAAARTLADEGLRSGLLKALDEIERKFGSLESAGVGSMRTMHTALRAIVAQAQMIPPAIQPTIGVITQAMMQIPQTIGPAMKTALSAESITSAVEEIEKARTKTFGWKDSLGSVAAAMSEIDRVSSGTFGSIVNGISSVVAGWDRALASMKQFKNGMPSGQQRADLAVGTVAGAAGVIEATGHGTKTQRAVGGVMSGASAGLTAGLMFGAKFGPYGAAIGAAAGLVIGLVRGANQGRKSIKDFASEFGGFDGLREKLNALGEEGDRLWVNLTQKVKNGDVKQAQAAIDAVTLALEAQKKKQGETAAAAREAAEAQVAAQKKIVDEIQGRLNGLNQEYDRLWESIKDEAPEEVMGIVETNTRARMAAIADERKAVEEELRAAQEAQQASFDKMAESMDGLTNALSRLTDRTWKIPVEIDYRDRGFRGPLEPLEPEASYARGGIIGHDQVARVHAGELIGPVDFVERALAGAMVRTGGGSGGRTMLQPIIVQVEGREIARVNARYQQEVLANWGVR